MLIRIELMYMTKVTTNPHFPRMIHCPWHLSNVSLQKGLIYENGEIQNPYKQHTQFINQTNTRLISTLLPPLCMPWRSQASAVR